MFKVRIKPPQVPTYTMVFPTEVTGTSVCWGEGETEFTVCLVEGQVRELLKELYSANPQIFKNTFDASRRS